nr:RNA-dependent RNA polymerase [Flumine noda-like virus 20]
MTADVDPAAYVKAAVSIGQVLECEPVSRGCEGVQFLARVYGPDVWFGDLNSCCDLPRQLGKFHTTVRLPSNVLPAEKLVEKAMSYYLTDKNTPIVGKLVRRVVDLAGIKLGSVPSRLEIVPWFARYSEDVQFPNEDSGWMEAYAARALPGFDRARFERWIASVDTLQACLSPPLCQEPKPIPPVKADVVVGDEVRRAPKKAPQAKSKRNDTKKNVRKGSRGSAAPKE